MIAAVGQAASLAALAWRKAAMADGWISSATYNHEVEEQAFTLRHPEGFHALGLARPPDAVRGLTRWVGRIHAWAPDGIHVPAGDVYDMAALRRAVQTCEFCKQHPVKTVRLAFVNRACVPCAETKRAEYEPPGWSE